MSKPVFQESVITGPHVGATPRKLNAAHKLAITMGVTGAAIVGLIVAMIVLSSTESTTCGNIVNQEPRMAPKPPPPTVDGAKIKV